MPHYATQFDDSPVAEPDGMEVDTKNGGSELGLLLKPSSRIDDVTSGPTGNQKRADKTLQTTQPPPEKPNR